MKELSSSVVFMEHLNSLNHIFLYSSKHQEQVLYSNRTTSTHTSVQKLHQGNLEQYQMLSKLSQVNQLLVVVSDLVCRLLLLWLQAGEKHSVNRLNELTFKHHHCHPACWFMCFWAFYSLSFLQMLHHIDQISSVSQHQVAASVISNILLYALQTGPWRFWSCVRNIDTMGWWPSIWQETSHSTVRPIQTTGWPTRWGGWSTHRI